jgi:ArsR family transcriptional regulator, arsenate/arsenite/antimonite-responsive transcriptional repressor
MEIRDVTPALAALAQENRLQVFRFLVETGTEGVAAGQIAERLAIPSPTLSFHLAQLRHAGLIVVRREGRSLIYAANYERMNALVGFLTKNCCGTSVEVAICKPQKVTAKARRHGGAAR